MAHRLTVTDDSGFLALVDHHAYDGFVADDWTFDGLMDHFRLRMAERSLLIWGTGGENEWPVEVRVGGEVPITSIRRTAGTIRVTNGQLLVTNYESLTMAAQFADERLGDERLIVDMTSGTYRCEIVQREDDFVIVLRPDDEDLPPWPGPMWFED